MQQKVIRLLPLWSDFTTFVHSKGESPPIALLRLSAATSSAWWHWLICATIRPAPSTLTASSPFCAGNFEMGETLKCAFNWWKFTLLHLICDCLFKLNSVLLVKYYIFQCNWKCIGFYIYLDRDKNTSVICAMKFSIISTWCICEYQRNWENLLNFVNF